MEEASRGGIREDKPWVKLHSRSHLGDIWERSGGTWRQLGSIWKDFFKESGETSGRHLAPRMHAGSYGETPRRHPGDSQRHPGGLPTRPEAARAKGAKSYHAKWGEKQLSPRREQPDPYQVCDLHTKARRHGVEKSGSQITNSEDTPPEPLQ